MTIGRLSLPGGLRRAVAGAAALALGACAAATVRPFPSDEPTRRAGALQVRWRTIVHAHELFETRAEECSAPVVVGDRLVLGTRGARILGIERATGRIAFSLAASGDVDSAGRLDPHTGNVYLGSDDGTLYAIDPRKGTVRWTARSKGAIERAPEVDAHRVFFTTAADKVVALDPASGAVRWQYERETPDGFTIHGQAGARLLGSRLYTGFTDGYLVSLAADSGEVQWARSLAGTADQFVDVDSTPAPFGDTVLAASYSGGLYALNAKDGGVIWKVPVEGAGSPLVVGDRAFLAAPRDGLHAVAAATGAILWRQALAETGDLTTPIAVGPYLVLTGSRAGMFVVDRATGRVVETFNPGEGVCGAPALDEDGHNLYVLANSGTLYALALAY